LVDFEQALLDKGNTAEHARKTARRARKVLEGIKATHWRQITAGAVQAWLAEQRRAGLSAESSNHYLRAVKNFLNWMHKDGRAPENPIKTVPLVNSRPDRRIERRALSAEELGWLLKTTAKGPMRYRMTGPERALLYRLAVETGLRASELRSLTPASFDLDADPPTVTISAAYAKNRRQDRLPLKPTTARLLADFLASREPNAPALNMPHACNVVRMFRKDLEDARQAWIKDARSAEQREQRERSDFLAYVDDAGRRADFHALRHTFISNLARGGVHPRTAQALARHSTITLTMDRYTHTVLDDQAAALAALPDLPGPDAPEEGEALRQAVGGPPAANIAARNPGAEASGPVKRSDSVAPPVAPNGCNAWPGMARNDQEHVTPQENEKCPESGISAANCNELQFSTALGRGGLEPPTQGFSVPCSTA